MIQCLSLQKVAVSLTKLVSFGNAGTCVYMKYTTTQWRVDAIFYYLRTIFEVLVKKTTLI